jgi:hypothetical protein
VSTRAESRPANSPSGSEAVSSPSGSQAASSRFASGPAGSRSASGPASYRSASGPARSQPAAVRARAPRCTASSQACRTRIRFGSARRRGPLTAVGIEPPKPTERRERSLGRTDDRATGRPGDWATGRLGDWATGRLGDWVDDASTSGPMPAGAGPRRNRLSSAGGRILTASQWVRCARRHHPINPLVTESRRAFRRLGSWFDSGQGDVRIRRISDRNR